MTSLEKQSKEKTVNAKNPITQNHKGQIKLLSVSLNEYFVFYFFGITMLPHPEVEVHSLLYAVSLP